MSTACKDNEVVASYEAQILKLKQEMVELNNEKDAIKKDNASLLRLKVKRLAEKEKKLDDLKFIVSSKLNDAHKNRHEASCVLVEANKMRDILIKEKKVFDINRDEIVERLLAREGSLSEKESKANVLEKSLQDGLRELEREKNNLSIKKSNNEEAYKENVLIAEQLLAKNKEILEIENNYIS